MSGNIVNVTDASFEQDALKTSAPFWKKEITGDSEHWVEQKASDVVRTQAWE